MNSMIVSIHRPLVPEKGCFEKNDCHATHVGLMGFKLFDVDDFSLDGGSAHGLHHAF